MRISVSMEFYGIKGKKIKENIWNDVCKLLKVQKNAVLQNML